MKLDFNLPELVTGDECVFDLFEGATLGIFGGKSFDVFIATSRNSMMGGLCYTVVDGFSKEVYEERIDSVAKDSLKRARLMLELSCIRRCVYPRLYQAVSDNCSAYLDEAADGDPEYRQAIREVLIGALNDLVDDESFRKYLKPSPTIETLEEQNFNRIMLRCSNYALKVGVPDLLQNTDVWAAVRLFLALESEDTTEVWEGYLRRANAEFGAQEEA